MKISNGNWLIQKNLQVMNPVYFYSAEKEKDLLRVYVAPKNIENRENQLDVPLFTYTFQTLQENSIGVKIEHFKGIYQQKPIFALHDDCSSTLDYQENDETIHLQSGRLMAVLHKTGTWQIEFLYDGRPLTESGPKSAGYAMDTTTHIPYLYEQLGLGVGELVYGLGERFTSFVKNGQSVEIWNRDGGTSTEQAYKNVPFYVTNRGYGVFIDQTDRVSLEVASEKVSQVQFCVRGESLSYHIVGGENLKKVLETYTAMTGRPPRLPAWSFGLWLSTSFTTNYDEKTVTSFIEGMKQRHIPLHVFHFDCFWMKGLHWCDFRWDNAVFPQPQAMLERLKAKGLNICVWINPYISQQSRLFAEGMQHHYFLENEQGNVWQWDRWQPGLAIVDFTNPEACRWYSGYLTKLLDMGVDCFKTDFGERIPTDVRYADGSDPEKMHNYYTYLYNKTVFDLLREKRGENEAILFARSATAGCQSFPVHWGGDCHGTYASMAETLRGGLSLGLSGFAFWSHDIGGFENTSPADVYKRWCAFGLLSSHSRLHGSKSYRIPWAYDDEAVNVLRFFTQWKCKLMPYIYQLAEIAHQTGLSLMRAMLLEFPEDPACEYLDRQYMLGDKLLIAPVMQKDGHVRYYLPDGTWTHLFSKKIVQGGHWQEENYDFMSLPIFVRENTILPLGHCTERPDYEYTKELTLLISHLTEQGKAKTRITSLDRKHCVTIQALRENTTYTLSFQGLNDSCSILLPPGKYKLAAGEADCLEENSAHWQIKANAQTVVFTQI